MFAGTTTCFVFESTTSFAVNLSPEGSRPFEIHSAHHVRRSARGVDVEPESADIGGDARRILLGRNELREERKRTVWHPERDFRRAIVGAGNVGRSLARFVRIPSREEEPFFRRRPHRNGLAGLECARARHGTTDRGVQQQLVPVDVVVGHKRIGEAQYAGVVVLHGAGGDSRVELLVRNRVLKTGLHAGAGKEFRFKVLPGVPVVVEVWRVAQSHQLPVHGHPVRRCVFEPLGREFFAPSVVVVRHDGRAVLDDYAFRVCHVEVVTDGVSV